MGAWGVALFSDDLAADLRDEFKDLIGDGLSPEEATKGLCKEYSDALDDYDERGVFWLALAAIQWQTGRLLPEVREQALGIIESGEDLRRWEESPKDLSRRRNVLDELRAKLLGPMPEAKKIPKRFRDSNDWPIGSIVGYRLSSGKLVLFRVATHHTDKGGTSPIVDVLDWQGDEIPSEGTIRKLRVLKPLRSWDNGRLLIGATSKREYPADRVLVTGLVVEPRPEGLRLPWTKPKPEQDKGCSGSLWRVLDRILDEIFRLK